jgi:hypothetical protein
MNFKMVSKAVLFTMVIFLLFSCAEEKENSLAGKWAPVVRPYNLGTTLIFGEDSSFIQIKDARVNYIYKLEDDTLISTSFDGFSGKRIIDSASVTIKGDTLILVRGKIGDQQETIMKRYDSVYTDEEGIIGFWKWPHKSGNEAISEFHPDGKASVSVLIDRREGNYFINGDSLTIVMKGTTYQNLHFVLKDDSLFFQDNYAPLGKSFYRVNEE